MAYISESSGPRRGLTALYLLAALIAISIAIPAAIVTAQTAPL